MKRSFLFILIFQICHLVSAQTIEPIKDLFPSKINYRKSSQLTTNSVFIQGNDMVTTNSFSTEYEQKIERDKNRQIITITNKKVEGYIDIMGNKQPIKDIPNGYEPIKIYTNKKGIIDSVIASVDMVNKLKQSISGRLEIGKPNPHILSVNSSKKIGDSWVDSSYYTDDKNYYIIYYKFEKQENNLNILSYTSDLRMVTNFVQNQMTFQTDVVGKSNGTIQVEPNSNYIVKSEGSMKLEGRIIANTQEYPTITTGTFSDELIK